MSIRLVLADGHALILLGMKLGFDGQPDMEAQAQCTDSETALEAIRRLRPDILIIDLNTTRGDPLKLVRMLQAESLPTRVIIHASEVRDTEILEEIRLGVRGVLLKSLPTQLLVQCVRKVAAGGDWLENKSVKRVLETVLQEKSSLKHLAEVGLTSREAEIVGKVAAGLSNKAIARELNLTEGTVKLHLHHIYKKLSLSGRRELMLYVQGKMGKSD